LILSEIDALAAQGFKEVVGATGCGMKAVALHRENVGRAFSHLKDSVGVVVPCEMGYSPSRRCYSKERATRGLRTRAKMHS